MRYPASEKLEIIRLVEQSHLPVRRTLDSSASCLATFYRWYDLYQSGGPEALEDRSPGPGGSGTASPTMFASRSSSWRWTSRSCRRGSWRCASPTPRATLCRKLRSIGC